MTSKANWPFKYNFPPVELLELSMSTTIWFQLPKVILLVNDRLKLTLLDCNANPPL